VVIVSKRVLDVGQCGFDHAAITRLLTQHFDVQVESAARKADALRMLRGDGFDLVCVNRLFDTDGSEGLDLLREIKADPELASLPVMLVSNFPEAQQAAVTAGAIPGFGKSDLASPAVVERLQSILD